MKYLSFSLENYKGIKEKVTIDINDEKSLSCIIGDNSSGKTTILQGIQLIGFFCSGNKLQPNTSTSIKPKGIIFSGDITFSATIKITDEEMADGFKDSKKRELIKKNSNIIRVEFIYTYNESGEFSGNKTIISIAEQKEDIIKSHPLNELLSTKLPEIIYYDDFDFQVPPKITFLKGNREDKRTAQEKNKAKKWNKIFDDILTGASEGKLTSFKNSVVDYSEDGAIDNRIQSMQDHLNKKIGEVWSEIANKKTSYKYLIKETSNGNYKHYALQVILGDLVKNTIFEINEQSKGTHWFFCFKIYTEIRANRDKTNGTIFLLDEPANNLHINPQEKVLQSLIDLAQNNNSVIYCTHSSYLVDASQTKNIYVVNNLEFKTKKRDITCVSTEKYKITKENKKSIVPILDSFLLFLKKKDYVKKFSLIKKLHPNFVNQVVKSGLFVGKTAFKTAIKFFFENQVYK